jgi:two-component system LytT family sensor kinase
MRSTLRKHLRTYGVCFLVWTGLGLYYYSQNLAQKFVSHDPTPWWRYLVSWMTGVYLCALLTPTIFWLGRRLPIERRNWLRRSAAHLLFGIIFSVVELAAHGGILLALNIFPQAFQTFGDTFRVVLAHGFHQDFLAYWTILGLEYGLRYYRGYRERAQHALRLELQASELKTQLVRAQLSALNMQLQPHFLFNTLNTIMVLVRQQKTAQAEEMLGRLSDLLRCVLDGVDTQEVPLRRELDYLEQYLSIEQVRFQDRLRVEIRADPSVLDAAVPSMGLQPIVENAIRHGIGGSSSAGRICISAYRSGKMVEIKVQDDGPGLAPDTAQKGGIGLTNTRERLRQLYGDVALLTVENNHPRGAVATMTLPYRPSSDAAEPEILELDAFHGADRG